MNRTAQYSFILVLVIIFMSSAYILREDWSIYDETFETRIGSEHIGIYRWHSEGNHFQSCDGSAVRTVQFDSLDGFGVHPKPWNPNGPSNITKFLRVRGEAIGAPTDTGMLPDHYFDSELIIYETLEISDSNIFDCVEKDPFYVEVPIVNEPDSIDIQELVAPDNFFEN